VCLSTLFVAESVVVSVPQLKIQSNRVDRVSRDPSLSSSLSSSSSYHGNFHGRCTCVRVVRVCRVLGSRRCFRAWVVHSLCARGKGRTSISVNDIEKCTARIISLFALISSCFLLFFSCSPYGIAPSGLTRTERASHSLPCLVLPTVTKEARAAVQTSSSWIITAIAKIRKITLAANFSRHRSGVPSHFLSFFFSPSRRTHFLFLSFAVFQVSFCSSTSQWTRVDGKATDRRDPPLCRRQ
jgi:hypothetical protein